MNLQYPEINKQLKHSVYYIEAGYVVHVQHVGLTIFETNIMVRIQQND